MQTLSKGPWDSVGHTNKSLKRLRTAVGISSLLTTSAALAGGWIELGIGFLTYKDAGPRDVLNVVELDNSLLAAASEDGLIIVDTLSGEKELLPPPTGLGSVDDVAVADGLVFVLDAREPGFVTVLDPRNDYSPTGAAVPVDVGPFSGVSVAEGVMVVSGGTKPMAWFGYGEDGVMSELRSRPDFGRGQPDVALQPDGKRTIISAHISGPDFGVIWAAVADGGRAIEPLTYIALEDAGFTRGGHRPANFPIQAALLEDLALIAHGGGVAVIRLKEDGAELLEVVEVGYPLVALTVSGSDVYVAGDNGDAFEVSHLVWQDGRLTLGGRNILATTKGRVSDLLVKDGRLWLATGEAGLLDYALP